MRLVAIDALFFKTGLFTRGSCAMLFGECVLKFLISFLLLVSRRG